MFEIKQKSYEKHIDFIQNVSFFSALIIVNGCKSVKVVESTKNINSELSAQPIAEETKFELSESSNLITHGPLLGKPSSTSMSICARTARPGIILVEAKKVGSPESVVIGEAQTFISKDNTGVVELMNLDPNSTY